MPLTGIREVAAKHLSETLRDRREWVREELHDALLIKEFHLLRIKTTSRWFQESYAGQSYIRSLDLRTLRMIVNEMTRRGLGPNGDQRAIQDHHEDQPPDVTQLQGKGSEDS